MRTGTRVNKCVRINACAVLREDDFRVRDGSGKGGRAEFAKSVVKIATRSPVESWRRERR